VVKKTYLQKTTLAQAHAHWFEALDRAGWFEQTAELVPTPTAHGRVSAAPIRAARAVPHVVTSAMDGIAVRAAATRTARIDLPLTLKRPEGFVRVDTGDPLPDACDAVIKVEDLNFLDERTVEIYAAAFPGQSVRPTGEDFAQGATLLGAHHPLTPEAVAACLAAGLQTVEVVRAPKALVIPTGSELADPLHPLPPGKYPETNTALFQGYLSRWQATPTLHPLIPDDKIAIQAAIAQGVASHDLVLINAGTSKGREDFTTTIIERLGKVLVHGISMHPGHPVVLGVVDGKPVVGVPGYPVATWIILNQLVLPLLEKYYGYQLQSRHTVKGRLARKVYSSLGEIEFVRVRLQPTDDGPLIHPLAGKASALSSLINANGILIVPEALSGYPKGEMVEVQLLMQ